MPVVSLNSQQTKEDFNKGYRFQDFVEGATNKQAYEICKHFVDQSSHSKHNLLFIYGASGLGKTHLVNAAGHSALEQEPNHRVLYMTSAQFVHAFTDAQEQNNLEKFKETFKLVDLLLIDDIQFLSSSSAEFSKTLDQILTDSKQTILTSDRHPKEITEIDSWVARFTNNQPIEIGEPTLENRVDILLYKAKFWDYELSSDCAFLIAQRNQGNVRELEGDFNKVNATARLMGTTINNDIINEVFRHRTL